MTSYAVHSYMKSIFTKQACQLGLIMCVTHCKSLDLFVSSMTRNRLMDGRLLLMVTTGTLILKSLR